MKFFMTEEKSFTLEFTDSEDARVFYNKADDEFGYCYGTIDTPEHLTVKASFENGVDAERFKEFVKDTLGEPEDPNRPRITTAK